MFIDVRGGGGSTGGGGGARGEEGEEVMGEGRGREGWGMVTAAGYGV